MKDRALAFGWDQTGLGILSISDNPVNPTSFKSLIEKHGEITLQEIFEFEETYISELNRSKQGVAVRIVGGQSSQSFGHLVELNLRVDAV